MKKGNSKASIDFLKFFNEVVERRLSERLNCSSYDIAFMHLQNFTSLEELSFELITPDWFERFRKYLSGAQGLRTQNVLSENSVNTYFRIVLSIAKEAADARLIDHITLAEIKNTSRTKSDNRALTNKELQLLASTPYRVPTLKNAFLFCCLTGMSWKQLSHLKWSGLTEVDGYWQIDVDESKENAIVIANQQARDLLGPPGKPDQKIFPIQYSAALCVNLNQWALKSGVYRNITFSVARQTFGKMLLDRDVPVELVSEMLGHRQVKTTRRFLE